MDVKIYRTYRFIDKDPIIDAVRTVVETEKLKNQFVHELSGVAATTLHNWFDGPTKKPNNATTCAVTAALGYVRRDRLRPDGTLEIGYVKARDYDYVKERDKAATWLLRQNSAKKRKPRKKKGNGHV